MSSYLVLARKYRPRTFDEVIGQEVVTRVLAGAIEEGRIGHAYLFAGPRGTGKTTTARILAKCLNCEEGPTARPCGKCERCLGAEAGSEVDIIEIDAASHTGVDNVRELRDEAVYAPMRGRHKVYIVDEVHMLSKPAFNALLKILEEPPEHVVFLFATTEPHKVLDTILSRCQVLRLSPIPEERIAARLQEVFSKEGVEAEDGVVRELARSARGGMRDALSMADKLLALAGNRPTLEDLSRLGGEGGAREIEELLTVVEAGDKPGLLAALARFVGDEGELLAGLLGALRLCVVLAHCGEETPIVAASEEERERAVGRATRLGVERLELWMQELLHARERMRLIPGQERTILEITLLDLCRAEASLPLGELVRRLEDLEARLGGGATPPAAPAREEPVPRPAPPPRSRAARGAGPGAPPGGRMAGLWNPFLDELARSHGALASLLEQRGSAASLEDAGEGAVGLRLAALGPDEEKLVRDRRNLAATSRALSRVAGRSIEVSVHLQGEADAGRPAPAATTGARAASGRSARGRDPMTEEAADLFGGVVEDLT